MIFKGPFPHKPFYGSMTCMVFRAKPSSRADWCIYWVLLRLFPVAMRPNWIFFEGVKGVGGLYRTKGDKPIELLVWSPVSGLWSAQTQTLQLVFISERSIWVTPKDSWAWTNVFALQMLKGEDPKVNGELSYLRGWRHLKGRGELAAACRYRTGEKKGREEKELFILKYNLGKKANTTSQTNVGWRLKEGFSPMTS